MEPISITEPNDVVGDALDVSTALQGTGEVVLAGEIGDTPGRAADVDLVSFTLSAGQIVSIETATGGAGLDTLLRLFDPFGAEVAFNDDRLDGEFVTLDSRIVHIAEVAGTFTVGVSDVDNESYDPEVAGSGTRGFTTGAYGLTVSLLDPPQVDPALGEANDTIAEAADVSEAFRAAGELVLTGSIGDNAALGADDVDLVTLELEAGEGVRVAVAGTGPADRFDFSPFAQAFDAAGAEEPLVFLEPDVVGFVAPEAGTFAVGVSSFFNLFYDPLVEGSGAGGDATGFYELSLAPLEFGLDLAEPNDTLAEAPDLTAELRTDTSLVLRGIVGDNPDLAPSVAADDVDLVSFTLAEGDRLDVAVDPGFVSGLEALLRVFGPDGEVLAVSDEEFGFDPFLSVTAPVAGTFTVGVSALGNVDYDPEVGGSGAGGDITGSYELFVDLTPAPVVTLIRGTAGDDRLVGDAGPDDIRGFAGDDDLRGRGGEDELRGGRGDDALRGGRGEDLLIGGSGDDVLRGGGGADELRGGSGDDILRGGAGGDLMIGGGGSDTFVLRGTGDVVRRFDVRNDPSERSFDTIVLGPGLVLRTERDFFELALSERAGYDLDFEADEAGVIRRADIENARTGETADIEILGRDMTLADFVLFQAEQIGLVPM